MALKSVKKYVAEGLMIIFSVLFALYISKLSDQFQINKRKEIALKGIEKEISRNTDIINLWIKEHSEIKHRVDSLVDGKMDSIKNLLSESKSLRFDLLTGKENFINSILSNTAWETAKSTGIISEFNFETNQDLTDVYTMQQIIIDKTIFKIVDLIFEKDIQNTANINSSLLQFQLLFNELIGQEKLMSYFYRRAKNTLETDLNGPRDRLLHDSISTIEIESP